MDNWRNLSVYTKLLWNQPSRIWTLCYIDWLSFNVFRQHVVCWPFDVEFCICILKAMTNYQPKLFKCLLSLTMLHGQILASF